MAPPDPSSRSSPPVAVRVVRPYPSEDALLAAEAGAFTRTGVVLIGAPSRPNGVVLRFEIALADGTPVMRGEGRVVGHRPATAQDEAALMLRFTRLDVKSKSLLDRAVALRDERRALGPSSAPRSASSASSMMAAINEPIRESTPEPPKVASSRPPTVSSSAPPRHPSASFAAPRPSLPSVAPVSPPPPPVVAAPIMETRNEAPDEAPSIDHELVDGGDVEEIDDVDEDVELSEGDRTVQAPPVAEIELAAIEPEVEPIEITHAAAPRAPEHAPAPAISPVEPHPAPVPKPMPAPPTRAPSEKAPPQRAPEHAPPPQRSPEPERRLLAGPRRDDALSRLRDRAKKLGALQSFFPQGDRSSAADAPGSASELTSSHTPVLGSLVAERSGRKN